MGYIYAFENALTPGLLKLGATERPWKERLKEANNHPFVIGEFVCVHHEETDEPFEAEARLHTILKSCRDRREYFRVDYSTAVAAMKQAVFSAAVIGEVHAVRKVKAISQVGAFIRQVRETTGMSQSAFASVCRVGRRCISEIEGGKESAEIGKVLKLLRGLGIELFIKLPQDAQELPALVVTDHIQPVLQLSEFAKSARFKLPSLEEVTKPTTRRRRAN